jgi:hypothetical protein
MRVGQDLKGNDIIVETGGYEVKSSQLGFYSGLTLRIFRLGYVFTLKLLMSGWGSRRHDIIVINRKEKDREYGWSRSSGTSSW